MLSVNTLILSIKEFIKTGKFGEVRIGMSKDDVINFLGAPDSDNDIGVSGSILLYAWYELFINMKTYLPRYKMITMTQGIKILMNFRMKK